MTRPRLSPALSVSLLLGLVPLASGEIPVSRPGVVDLATPDGTVDFGVKLAINPMASAEMALEPRVRVEGFPLSDGRGVTLVLERFEVLSADAQFVHVDDDGREIEMPRPDVQLWRGKIEGEPDSKVFLGMSDLLGLNGFVQSAGKVNVVSSGPQGAFQPVVWDANMAAVAAGMPPTPLCGGAVLPEGVEPPPVQRGDVAERGSFACKNFRVAVDCDTEFTSSVWNGNAPGAQAYATLLMGAVSEIYQSELNIRLEMPFVRTWGANDPYTQGGTCSQLDQFRSYWQSNMGGTSRNVAHLLSGRNLGGGCAYLSSLCNGLAYGVSANLNGGFPYPLVNNNSGNWDLVVTSHELGHNFGSGHTHDQGSYNPPIDNCGNNNCTGANLGTIMSYCHLCGGGLSNISLTFGPRVIAAIRGYVDGGAAGCGSALPVFTQTPTSQVASEGNPITFTSAVSSVGAGTYQWRRNGTPLANNARISGATSPQLRIQPVIPGDSGNYTMLYTSAECGSLTTSSVSLSVNAACVSPNTPPSISDQPEGMTINRGQAAMFSVEASGAGPITYRWRKGVTELVNDGRITGADSPTLTVNNAQAADAGDYNVVVTGATCYTTSNYATLGVVVVPASFDVVFPLDGATDVVRNPFFDWEVSEDATLYNIIVDDDADLSSPLFNVYRTISDLPTQNNSLQAARTYYWKVTASNQYGEATIAPGIASFTTAAPPPPACPGDANSDNVVNGADLSLLLGQFGGPVTPEFGADFNGDGLVNGADLSVLLSFFGESCD